MEQAHKEMIGILHEKLLECSICLETYRNPKALSCLHVFCEQCLQKHIAENARNGSFSCPQCREQMSVPTGGATALRSSFLHSCLADELKKYQPGILCTQCTSQTSAEFVCRHCSELLCADCRLIHQRLKKTASHEVSELTTVSTLKDFLQIQRNHYEHCASHTDVVMNLFCEVTHAPMCSLCVYSSDHREHLLTNHKPLSEKREEYKGKLKEFLDKCTDKETASQQVLEQLNNLCSEVKANESLLLMNALADKERLNQLVDLHFERLSNRIKEKTLDVLRPIKELELKVQSSKDTAKRICEELQLLEQLPTVRFVSSFKGTREQFIDVEKSRKVSEDFQMAVQEKRKNMPLLLQNITDASKAIEKLFSILTTGPESVDSMSSGKIPDAQYPPARCNHDTKVSTGANYTKTSSPGSCASRKSVSRPDSSLTAARCSALHRLPASQPTMSDVQENYDMSNIFARIIRGELMAATLYEDEQCLAIKHVRPCAPTHFVVLPKKLVASLNWVTDYDEQLLGHLLVVARNVAKEQEIANSGYRLVVNVGPQAGQDIPHLHVHVAGGMMLPALRCP